MLNVTQVAHLPSVTLALAILIIHMCIITLIGPFSILIFFRLLTDDRDQKIVIIQNYILSLTMLIVPCHFLSVNPIYADLEQQLQYADSHSVTYS